MRAAPGNLRQAQVRRRPMFVMAAVLRRPPSSQRGNQVTQELPNQMIAACPRKLPSAIATGSEVVPTLTQGVQQLLSNGSGSQTSANFVPTLSIDSPIMAKLCRHLTMCANIWPIRATYSRWPTRRPGAHNYAKLGSRSLTLSNLDWQVLTFREASRATCSAAFG